MKSEEEQKFVQNIRNEYVSEEKEPTKIEQLKQLHKKVKKPALVFAYIFGIVGSLVLGLGMCLAMKVIGDSMIVGIVIGLIGIAMVSVNYYLYGKIIISRKKKNSKEILALSDELLK